ncbi:putative nucleotide-binding protein [Clostridium putrefaciens]|uniref:Nucleotide-binding protein NCTC9836_00684 n=1 Tax=Clostridium putrefaciens TaxID=99675 RepID=A0A381J7P0_9CLOT|nr:YajQ family cyclic di-GMP-binding protein [Clostridium putrefaciens]SUY46279.1 putative nucleotide-binding protein [Clostridium putrefaciens]
MASNYSFDVVSKVDMQEVDNAINQTLKEISQRYDFKGSKSTVELVKNEVKIASEDDFRLKAVIEILKVKLIKRGISAKALDFEKVEDASMGTVRQVGKIVNGIEKEKSKLIVNEIKSSKIKVQTQILDDELRITGKNKDDLQAVMALLRGKDFGIELQFINYR